MGIHNALHLAAVDMVSAGILGLAFILVVVFAVLAAKHWHWVNIVFLVLCFLTGTGAIWGMTEVYSKRSKAIKAAVDAEKKATKAIADADLAIKGEASSLTYDPGTLRAVSEELSREFAGRGRVWSHGQIEATGGLRKFTFEMPRVLEDEADSLKDVVLYAFLERQVSNQVYPSRYIGAVRVKEDTGDDVTLEGVAMADPDQFTQPTGTWSLFEKMPLDRSGLFRSAIVTIVNSNEQSSAEEKELAKQILDESTDVNITLLRQILMSDLFLPAATLGFDPQSKEYEELVDRYAFDGMSLGKIQNWIDQNTAGRKSTRFEPLPEEVFVQYRFNKKSSKSYQVDANGSVENDGLFTPLGQAVDPALHAGKEVEFAEGDTVLVDKKSVDGYQRGGVQIPPFKQGEDVTEIDQKYFRQVRDFPYEFADSRIQTQKLVSEIERITRANEIQQKSIDDANTQIDQRSQLTANLEADGENLEKDLSVISLLAQQRKSEIDAHRNKIADLEKRIQNTYAQLRNLAVTLSQRAFGRP